MLKRIHVTYYLKLEDPGKRETVERVCATHARHCPVARSIMPAIEVTTSVEIEMVA